uniref:Putative secreted protein n=1 Tax=Anopheles marajoara TaxID=58244 RepID=A0A2M4CDI7_9DIPT
MVIIYLVVFAVRACVCVKGQRGGELLVMTADNNNNNAEREGLAMQNGDGTCIYMHVYPTCSMKAAATTTTTTTKSS